MIYVGIDPGMSGGICWIDESPGIPLTFTVNKFADKTEKDIADIFAKLPVDGIFAAIESVHSMPKQGVSSSFKFGANFGLLKGFLYAFNVPFELVSPQRWQKIMGCMTHGDKNVSKTKAQQLFPQIKITHAIADALLLAEYARRTYMVSGPPMSGKGR